ncbi:transcription elongation regulator [Coemansia sp. RSA 922]|nr:transcription elongation regulator [Coemansia sp. S3946]KAJ2116577.1 transcription elongation regulator [Coemansia sp. RSA 922]
MANDHDWAVFLAPADTQGRTHLPNEPYYFERNNEITTWIRPFDYTEPSTDSPLSIGESWQRQAAEHRLQKARTHAKADRPLAQTPLNSDWKRVTTVQGREYFYNTETKTSQWDQPKDLETPVDMVVEEGTEMTADDVDWMLAQMDEEPEEDEDNEDMEAEQDTEDRLPADDLSKDERIVQFKAMLHDKGVNPFGTWEMQINSYESDPRFALINTDAERRELFDVVCKETAKKPRQDTLHPFDQLLCEKVTKKKTSFAKFCQKNLKDPRFTTIKTSREREKRFDKHLESISQ